jgi:heme exporter protein C
MQRTLHHPKLTALAVAAWSLTGIAVILALFVAREATADQGGPLQRIFYFHVPAAWVGYLAFAIVFISSIAYLRTRSPRWDLLAHGAAEIGTIFVTLVLVTGPIWARPVWGTWWEWDARLTSAFVMWLTYVGYLFLRALTEDPRAGGRLAAVVGIVGFINVPIVHFSVYWWRTLHPPGPTPANLAESSGLGGPELLAFFTSLVAFTLLAGWMLAVRVRIGRLAAAVDDLEVRADHARAREGDGLTEVPAL